MISPSASHDTTPLLLASASGHVSPSYTPHSSYASSVISPPSSTSSSSSSMTVRLPPSSRTQQTNPAHLRAPQAQETQGLTPPPSYSSLGSNPPPNPWTNAPMGASDPPHFESYNPRAPTADAAQGDNVAGSPPVFDLFASASPNVHQFGPTPLGRAATVPYAAYIDAPGAPDARARRRFVGAFGLALLLCLIMSVGVALEVIGERGWIGWDLKR